MSLTALTEAYGTGKSGPVTESEFTGAEAQVTKLDNGVSVVSIDHKAHVSTVGAFIRAGSRHENPDNSGASFLLQHIFFRDTAKRTHMSLVGEVEALGGNVSAAATRELSVLWADCRRDTIPEFFDIIVDTLRTPSIVAEDFPNYYMSSVTQQLSALSEDPRHVLHEAIHNEAYSHATLGRDLYVNEATLRTLSAEAVASFVAERFTARNIVIAGVNTNHDELVSLAQDNLGDLPASAGQPQTEAVYQGGESRITATAPETNVGLVFNGTSVNSPDIYAQVVASQLLGGGDSFSSGGPGKGMYSRLYRNVLNKHHWVHSVASIQASYTDGGVFGIRGSSHASNAGGLTAMLITQLQELTGAITDEELNRAKAMVKSAVFMNLEQRMSQFEDLGSQMLNEGGIRPISETVAKLDAVSAADINNFAKKLLSSQPTLVSHGDVSQVPRASQVVGMLKQ
eukprot:TRINITY_DN299_c0_g1_i1.p2 TRINITY_DN299_c0_g1~~TRINITY_DN299_c0_g1_i1.p2  ORF type:complete len:455 (-),score=152.13 TRINITY_DN299_c0_g1_i1:1060-2424(-)